MHHQPGLVSNAACMPVSFFESSENNNSSPKKKYRSRSMSEENVRAQQMCPQHVTVWCGVLQCGAVCYCYVCDRRHAVRENDVGVANGPVSLQNNKNSTNHHTDDAPLVRKMSAARQMCPQHVAVWCCVLQCAIAMYAMYVTDDAPLVRRRCRRRGRCAHHAFL